MGICRGIKHQAGNLLKLWGAPRYVAQSNCKIGRPPESLKVLNLEISLPFMEATLEDYRPTLKLLLKTFLELL